MNIISLEDRYRSGVYSKRDLAIVRGRGATLWAADGRSYLDCVSGLGVTNLGHSHPAIAAAIGRQAETLLSCPELFYNDQRAAFLSRLVANLPPGLERIFLCNSGTEAVEGALKFARLATGRSQIAAAMRGFHGRTMGALSATHNARYRQPFMPLVPGFTHFPFGNVGRLEAAITEETAAVILEVVQGEGGVRVGEPAFFQAAQRLCHERGAMLIIDEVQTGFGRTGHWFASEYAGVVPDLICLGKAIANGVPMGAIAIGPRVSGLGPGLHSSTFGGNPLACAAGLATLEVLESEQLPDRAAELGAYLHAELEAIDAEWVREVRGLGLMIGLELKVRAAPLVRACMERGLLTLTAGANVLRLLPPLVITRQEVDTVIQVIAEVLHEAALSRETAERLEAV